MSCACCDHPRYPNVLAVSSGVCFAFATGFVWCWSKRVELAGPILCMGLTSVAYHTTHAPRFRQMDVAVVYGVTTAGFALALWRLAMTCSNLFVLCAVIVLYACNTTGLDAKGRIPLGRHVFIHVLGACALCAIVT